MKKDKFKLTLLIIILALLTMTTGLWIAHVWKNNPDIGVSNTALPIIMFIIIGLMIAFAVKYIKSIRNKMPVEDERSKKANLKAGYYTFLFSVYLLLGLGWFGDDYFTRPSQATGAAILVMAIVFISLLFFERKGKL